ncbi:flagella synthesis protein FlgN [Chitinasiproducens palmae]|uniref:Flagellar biosynthesis/type III secretory pathway chaperone n=1 Tax=Chitinasiproducens palmae TaxID=1770053 RepID=A0A1H2PJP9_9BURK|nr:flagellar protein FlgN [Chitinasiproducens palmae]SDV46614.1 Flagellar biosynthesis/type III secretory pathway chaperone [Chitinasiproducens palmae]
MSDAPQSTVAPAGAALGAWLSAEREALEAILASLIDEQQALARGGDAMAALPDALRRKQSAAETLRALDAALPARLGVAADGLPAAFKRALDADPGLAAQWSEVSALAARARAENDGNGRLVTTRLHYNRAALDALLAGRDGDTPSPVYGANGRLVPR